MYRKCKIIHAAQYHNEPVEMDPSYKIEGHEDFIDEATELYLKYRDELERIMYYFGCKHESELFIGIHLDKSMEDDTSKGNLSQMSSLKLVRLCKFYRDLFFERLGLSSDNYGFLTNKAFQMASAWLFQFILIN